MMFGWKECIIGSKLFGQDKRYENIMSALTDLRDAIAKVQSDLATLSTDITANAAALATAQANAVTETDVANVQALDTTVQNLIGQFNPPTAT